MWNLKVKINESIQQDKNRFTDVENNLVIIGGEREGEEARQWQEIKRSKLLYIKQIGYKDILNSTGKQNYLVKTFNGVQSIKILNHQAVHLKLI